MVLKLGGGKPGKRIGACSWATEFQRGVEAVACSFIWGIRLHYIDNYCLWFLHNFFCIKLLQIRNLMLQSAVFFSCNCFKWFFCSKNCSKSYFSCCTPGLENVIKDALYLHEGKQRLPRLIRRYSLRDCIVKKVVHKLTACNTVGCYQCTLSLVTALLKEAASGKFSIPQSLAISLVAAWL